MKIGKNIQSMYQKKYFEEKHVDLLLIGEEGKRYYVFVKEFNTFMYDYTLPRGRKHFCRCVQAVNTEEILKHINDHFKINGKERMILHKTG